MIFPIIFLVMFLLAILVSAIKILREYERMVIFRLGRFLSVKGPGLIFLIPFVDKGVRVSLRTIVMDVPAQDVITKDNVSIKVNAVLYFRVMEADKAIISVENYFEATSQLSQTTLRSIMGNSELDEILSEQDKINARLQQVIDKQSDAWGIKVSLFEVKHNDLPKEMQRAMARQAESERERRSKIIAAEGEYQASEKLGMAAEVIGKHPVAIQLRFLQTLTEVAVDKNSTVILPIPIELLKPFMEKDK